MKIKDPASKPMTTYSIEMVTRHNNKLLCITIVEEKSKSSGDYINLCKPNNNPDATYVYTSTTVRYCTTVATLKVAKEFISKYINKKCYIIHVSNDITMTLGTSTLFARNGRSKEFLLWLHKEIGKYSTIGITYEFSVPSELKENV